MIASSDTICRYNFGGLVLPCNFSFAKATALKHLKGANLSVDIQKEQLFSIYALI